MQEQRRRAGCDEFFETVAREDGVLGSKAAFFRFPFTATACVCFPFLIPGKRHRCAIVIVIITSITEIPDFKQRYRLCHSSCTCGVAEAAYHMYYLINVISINMSVMKK